MGFGTLLALLKPERTWRQQKNTARTWPPRPENQNDPRDQQKTDPIDEGPSPSRHQESRQENWCAIPSDAII